MPIEIDYLKCPFCQGKISWKSLKSIFYAWLQSHPRKKPKITDKLIERNRNANKNRWQLYKTQERYYVELSESLKKLRSNKSRKARLYYNPPEINQTPSPTYEES
jgi:hypothetical protein